MRERRWESRETLDFNQVLAVGERLRQLGLKPAHPAKDIICYIEEWEVKAPEDIDQLDAWATEDITLVLVHENWEGDFFLYAGAFHTLYRQHEDVTTYCSVSHPWRLTARETILPRAMLWLGFRHTHAFIRVRLQTSEVVTPGERREDARRPRWLEDRRHAFDEAITLLTLPIRVAVDRGQVRLEADSAVPLFCSWPDAFGPCQFEYNSPDPFEFLVPASRLVATWREPATVRTYVTGFPEQVLGRFQALDPASRLAYRCSAHCALDEVPEMLQAIAPTGRLYATLCEFQSHEFLPDVDDASVIIGIVGANGAFQIEARLNRAPLPEEAVPGWLESMLGMPVSYAPLPPFV